MGAEGDLAMKELLDRRRRSSVPAEAQRNDGAEELVSSRQELPSETALEQSVAS